MWTFIITNKSLPANIYSLNFPNLFFKYAKLVHTLLCCALAMCVPLDLNNVFISILMPGYFNSFKSKFNVTK